MSIVPMMKYGWRKDQPDFRDHLFAAPGPLLQTLPSSVDLRPQCPPVYDQLALGACTSNAIAAAIEFDQKRQGLPEATPSRLFIYFNERQLEGTIPVDSGARIRDGIRSVNRMGECPEILWPYDISQFGYPAKNVENLYSTPHPIPYRKCKRLREFIE